MKKYSIDNILRMFTARYTVQWEKPNLKDAVSDYFGNLEACSVFSKQGLVFTEDRELSIFLASGKLMPIQDEILSKIDNFFSDSKDLNEKLRDQTYSQAYNELERKLEQGDILLDAPIVVKFKDGSYWGLSGKRRAYVARKHGVPVLYFIVEQKETGDADDKDDKKEEQPKSEMAEELFSS